MNVPFRTSLLLRGNAFSYAEKKAWAGVRWTLRMGERARALYSADTSDKEQGRRLATSLSGVFCFKWSKKFGCFNEQSAEGKLAYEMPLNKQGMFIIGKDKFKKKGTSLKSKIVSFLIFYYFPNMVKLWLLQI